MKPLCWLEISVPNLVHNLSTLKQLAGGKTLVAAGVKANGFNHGLEEVGRIFHENGSEWLFVNNLAEAKRLRRARINCPILLAAYVPENQLEEVILLGGVRIMVNQFSTLKTLEKLGKKLQKKIPIHLMIDTGMHREGIPFHDWQEALNYCLQHKNLFLEGLCTHLATYDDLIDMNYYAFQIKRFELIRIEARKRLERQILSHLASSGETLIRGNHHYDMIRPAAGLYGIYPNSLVAKLLQEKGLELKPTLSFKTIIARIEKIPAKTPVGYGGTFQSQKPMTIAMIPAGYYEGIDRHFANRGQVLVGGKKVPIIGKISMHMTTIDISQVPDADLEDEVVIIGQQGGEKISTADIADQLLTNEHEVMLHLQETMDRVYLSGSNNN